MLRMPGIVGMMRGNVSLEIKLKSGTESIFRSDVENKKAFGEKMKAIMKQQIEQQVYDDDIDLKVFYNQTKKLANDLYDYVEEFEKEMCQKWEEMTIDDEEPDEMPELDMAEYGSGEYSYERLSKAKLACKEAVQKMYEDMEAIKERDKMPVPNIRERSLNEISNDVNAFIEEFQESFDDYVELYCEIEVKRKANKMKKRFDKTILAQMWNRQNMQDRLKLLQQEDSTRQMPGVQSFFEMCTYDRDESGRYSYHMEQVFLKVKAKGSARKDSELVDAVLRATGGKSREDYVIKEIQEAISNFAVEIKMNLLAMAVERI